MAKYFAATSYSHGCHRDGEIFESRAKTASGLWRAAEKALEGKGKGNLRDVCFTRVEGMYTWVLDWCCVSFDWDENVFW